MFYNKAKIYELIKELNVSTFKYIISLKLLFIKRKWNNNMQIILAFLILERQSWARVVTEEIFNQF